MSFARDTAATLVSRAVILGFGFVQSIVVARLLQPEGRGIFGVLMLLPQVFFILVPLGLHHALTYRLRSDPERRENYVAAGFGIALVLAPLGYGACYLAGWIGRDDVLAGLPLAWFALACATVPLGVAHRLWSGVLLGIRKILAVNKINALRAAIQLGTILIVVGALDGGVPGLLAAVVLSECVVAVLLVRAIGKGREVRPRLPGEELPGLVGYGLRSYLFTILLFLNYRVDVYLLNREVDFEQVGLYVTAVALVEILWRLPNAFGWVLFPTISGATEEQRARLTPRVCRITLAFVALAALAGAAVAYPGMRLLYGEAFVPAAAPLIAILPGIVAMGVQQVLGADISGRGHPGSIAFAAAAGLAVNVALNLVWIPRFGIVGAAWASTLSYLTVMAVVVAIYTRLSGIGVVETLVVRGEDLRGIAGKLAALRGGER